MSEDEEDPRRKKDRSESIRATIGGPEDTDSDTSPTVSESSKVTSPEQKKVKERKSLNMYIGENLINETQELYEQLNQEHREKWGVELSKNNRYYPALIKHGIENSDAIRQELNLEENQP